CDSAAFLERKRPVSKAGLDEERIFLLERRRKFPFRSVGLGTHGEGAILPDLLGEISSPVGEPGIPARGSFHVSGLILARYALDRRAARGQPLAEMRFRRIGSFEITNPFLDNWQLELFFRGQIRWPRSLAANLPGGDEIVRQALPKAHVGRCLLFG